MKYLIASFSFLLLTSTLNASSGDKLQRLDWNGIEVVWLEDNRLPTYAMSVYFADGGLSDGNNKGLSNAALSLINLGTHLYTREQIAEDLEFYGSDYGINITHEYSTLSVSGLVKDMNPTMKKVCHLFRAANYPSKELANEIKRKEAGLKSMANDHGSLASRVFREISLRGSDYSYPVEGKLKDFKNFTPKNLKRKLHYFNKEVLKRIYISGPSQIKNLKNIINFDCGWNGKSKFVRKAQQEKPLVHNQKIVLVSVPGANQAQVRIGRYLNKKELKNRDAQKLASKFLGGGFTSRLMRELRVKRGLTYSVGSAISGQRDYGRALISTFTKNKTLKDLIQVTKDTIENAVSGKVNMSDFERAKSGMAGGYPFRFESSDAHVSQLLMLDHTGESYKEFYDFPNRVLKMNYGKVKDELSSIFDWQKQTVVVIGDKALVKQLESFGKVEVIDYKSFL